MKFNGFIVAIVVLAALGAALYWSNHHMPSETTQASAETPPKILTLNEADINKIDIKKKGGEEVTHAKDSGANWKDIALKPLGADQSAVSSMHSSLSSLNSDRLVEEKASNFNQYGLSEPTIQIGVVEKNNKAYELLVGDDTPTNNGAYVRVEGDPRVFTLAAYNKTTLDKSLNDLRDKRLLTLESDKISRIELTANKQIIEFGRNKDQWQILRPKPLRADSAQVDELLRKLTDAKMESGSETDSKKTASAFTSGARVAIAKLTTDSGTQVLELRKNKDEYYAKSSVVDGVYKASNDVGQGFYKKLDEFRNRKLFDFGFSDPDKIEIHDGSKAYFLTKGGRDWWSGDGKKMDATSVESLSDKIRDLQATKFLESGFNTPSIDVTISSNDRKRREKALIAKYKDSYIAKRENEPVLYELDSKLMEALQNSAKDLKPAAISKK